MEKEKPPNHVGLGRLPPLPSPSNSQAVKSDPSSQIQSPESVRYSHDISRMPDFPPRNSGHRRAHSEILGLPDDISFDSELGVVGSVEGPAFSDDTEDDLFNMYFDLDSFGSSSATSGPVLLGRDSVSPSAPVTGNDNILVDSVERHRVRHQHSQSMDGSTSIKPELLVSGSEESSLAETKKAMSAAKLADLALIDPKRAKRIWANRQSAARSKERKMRYISELERKVQTLQTEATTLSAQLTMLQRDTNGLTAENNELKLRLQTMEQQVHLQDALNDALREEVQRLKMVTGQALPNGGPNTNFGSSFGLNQQYYNQNQANQAMHTLMTTHQLQQLQIHSQQLHPQHQQATDSKIRGSSSSPNQKDLI